MAASTSMKMRPRPTPNKASPTMVIMSPMGAEDACAYCIGIPAIEKIISRKILEQVTEAALHQQRRDDRNGNVAFRVLGLASHRGHRFEADQDQNGDRGLHKHEAKVVHSDDRPGVGMRNESAGGVGLRIADVIRHRLAGRVQLAHCGVPSAARVTVSVAVPLTMVFVVANSQL